MITSADGSIRLLLVDDNIFALDIMVMYFSRINIECDTAENGQIGLQMYLNNPKRYSMIFLDLQMPVVDGFEMAKCIRESQSPTAASIPIIAMSGTNSNSAADVCIFNFFLKKPFELSVLSRVVEELLNKQ